MALRQTTYGSITGLNTASVPWRLWDKAKKLMWDPAAIDFSQDATDWAKLTDVERDYLANLGTLFMVGEECVTLDIIPLLQAMADGERLEEAMYLTTFVFEEAKHIDFFRRWFDAVKPDLELTDYLRPGYRKIFDEELPTVMRRLRDDRSPRVVLDAALTYNQTIEGVLALTGYRSWDKALKDRGLMPGLQEGLKGVQRDERRHMAYGTYVCRRIVAADPAMWDYVQTRMAELQQLCVEFIEEGQDTYSEPYPFGVTPEWVMNYALTQVPRRLEVIEVARHTTPEAVERDTVEEDLEAELEQV